MEEKKGTLKKIIPFCKIFQNEGERKNVPIIALILNLKPNNTFTKPGDDEKTLKNTPAWWGRIQVVLRNLDQIGCGTEETLGSSEETLGSSEESLGSGEEILRKDEDLWETTKQKKRKLACPHPPLICLIDQCLYLFLC